MSLGDEELAESLAPPAQGSRQEAFVCDRCGLYLLQDIDSQERTCPTCGGMLTEDGGGW